MREFALQYEKPLLEPFGLTGYGCCEDLSRKLDDVLTIPHIRRISISPFADVDLSAARLKLRAQPSSPGNPSRLTWWAASIKKRCAPIFATRWKFARRTAAFWS